MKRNDETQLNYTAESNSMIGTAFIKTIIFNTRLRSLFCEEIKMEQFKEGLFDTPSVNKYFENKSTKEDDYSNYKRKIDSQEEIISIALRYMRDKQSEDEFLIEMKESKEMFPSRILSKVIKKIGRWNGFFLYSKKNASVGFRYNDKHYYGFFYT